MKQCYMNNCGRNVSSRGMCVKHYLKWWRSQGTNFKPIQDSRFSKENVFKRKFWDSVTVTPYCWYWTGAKNSTGYGITGVLNDKGEKLITAHRFSYYYLVGNLEDGMVIDHKCHTPNCLNPDHLQQVSTKANSENRSSVSVKASSGHRGVHLTRNGKSWSVAVGHNYKVFRDGEWPLYEIHVAAYKAKILRNKLHTNNLLDKVA